MRYSLAATIAASLSILSPTAVACELVGFDQTPPAAIRGSVDDQFAKFDWSSDVDIRHGRSWVWNYISNSHSDKRWFGFWDKAHIRIPVSNPLPPGKAACREILVGLHDENPDIDAPIIYATNNQRQPGAVFVASPREETVIRIRTNFLDKFDISRALVIDVVLVEKVRGIYDFMIKPNLDDIIVGISHLQNVFSNDVLLAQVASMKNRGAKVETASLSMFVGEKAASELYFYDKQIAEDFTFFHGVIQETFSVSPSAIAKGHFMADLVVLDSDRRPLFGSKLRLPMVR